MKTKQNNPQSMAVYLVSFTTRQLRVAITALLLFHTTIAFCQPDAADELMYKAYLSREGNTNLWNEAAKLREADFNAKPTDMPLGYQLALAKFGLLNATMRKKDETLFNEHYEGTVELIEKLIASDKKWGEPRALLSAVYGLKMAYSPMQGMFLGSKSSGLADKAIDLSPASPFVWKVYANSKFFTPEMFGGDLKEAIESYEKSVALYEASPTKLKSNWYYLDALAFLGQAYAKNGENGKAIATYEKAISVEPEFGWVKYRLLPIVKEASQN